MRNRIKQLACLLSFILLVIICQAQTLGLSTDKTTSLVFPFPIKHVDRGTDAVLAQRVEDNILLVKAAAEDFAETNLSVFTGDGSVYTYRVLYERSPRVWVYRMPVMTNASIAMYANAILDNPRTSRGVHDKKWNIEAHVTGIYIKNDVIYYQLRIWNRSPVDYDTELLRFFIRDKKRAKRTAVQEKELTPLYMSGRINVVKAYSDNIVVLAFNKFTLPDAKFLGIQLMEQNGGRHLQMKVKNKDLMKGVMLPDLR